MASDVTSISIIVLMQCVSRKPLPLTTVDLQKAGSRLLRISPKKILDVCSHILSAPVANIFHNQIAERLYQQGFLSYPRTETDQFDPQFDFMTLIDKQTVDPTWGAFATGSISLDFFRFRIFIKSLQVTKWWFQCSSEGKEERQGTSTHSPHSARCQSSRR